MTEKKKDKDEVNEKSSEHDLDSDQDLKEFKRLLDEKVAKAKAALASMSTEDDSDDKLESSKRSSTDYLSQVEDQLDEISEGCDVSEMKRPSDMTMEDIQVLEVPPILMEGFYERGLSDYEVMNIKENCETAGYNLGDEDDLEDLEDLAARLKKAYAELLEPRRLLAFKQGYLLTDISAKKVEEKDVNKANARIEKDIERAHEGITNAIDWIDLESSDPNAQPLADALDQALASIADADAVVKCLESSADKEDK